MKLMRIENDAVAEIVDVPDTVTELVQAADERAGGEAIYQERPATAADFFHPDAGFAPAAEGAEVGFVRKGKGWSAPPPPEILPPPTPEPTAVQLRSALEAAGMSSAQVDALFAAARALEV